MANLSVFTVYGTNEKGEDVKCEVRSNNISYEAVTAVASEMYPGIKWCDRVHSPFTQVWGGSFIARFWRGYYAWKMNTRKLMPLTVY